MCKQSVDTILGDGQLRIVEIVGVNGNTVDEGSESRAAFCSAANQRGISRELPKFSAYLRLIGPDSAIEPARARPKPSRIDFLPEGNNISGNVFIFQIEDKLGDIFSQA